MSDDKIRIQNFDILISLNIGSVYHAFALKLNVCGFRLVGLAAVLDCKTLDIMMISVTSSFTPGMN